jgi:hypothetical protein
MTGQEIRRAMNEAVYRTAGRDAGEETLFFCECGDGNCVERVPLRLEDYESVRQDGAANVVAAGHDGARLVT